MRGELLGVRRDRRCVGEEWYELRSESEGKTRKEKEEDWGVVALCRPINQHRSKGLGLSIYVCTHIHISVSPIIKCPVVRASDYKVPNWLFGQ